MRNFGVTYDEMESTAAKLEEGNDEIVEILLELRSEYEALTANGFTTGRASSVMQAAFEVSSGELEEAARAVEGVARSLRAMADMTKDLDDQLASRIF